MLKDNLIEAVALPQMECFEAGQLFARTEGIIPAPESTHGIAQVLREVQNYKEKGESKTILFNLSGHGFVDMQAYDDFNSGKLEDHELDVKDIEDSIATIGNLQPK